MGSKIDREKLLARTRTALRGLGEIETEIAKRDRLPEPGDLYLFQATEDLEWAVIERSGDGRFLRVVAADVDPLVGSADVEVPATAAAGPLTLRCRFDSWCEVEDFKPELRAGFLDAEVVEQARSKCAEIEIGALSASLLEEEVDEDPEYEDREVELAAARARLAEDLSDGKIGPGAVDGTLGGVPWPSLDFASAAELARGEHSDPGEVAWWRHAHYNFSQPVMGLPTGADPADLTHTGWAIVLHADESPVVREALEPLLEYRRAQAGGSSTKVLEVKDGEDVREWLARHGVAAGDADPAKVPWYLLLVGSPARIPFRFQSLLAAEYAVGRLSFDTPEAYRRYAESVVAQDTATSAPPAGTAVFWSPRHRDPATRWTADLLVRPLMEGVEGRPAVAAAAGFESVRLWGEGATKAALRQALHGIEAPALLFAAAPGLRWPAGHPERRATQGALVCQEASTRGSIDREHYFAAADVGDDARVQGTVAFVHAAYGAGTPRRDDLSPEQEESEPFVAALPQRLLAHPGGGALAVVGLVGRAWATSKKLTPATAARIEPFEKALREILAGVPVAHALRAFQERHAARATDLAEVREKAAFGNPGAHDEVARAWVERNEAGSYVLLGDPAARLRAG